MIGYIEKRVPERRFSCRLRSLRKSLKYVSHNGFLSPTVHAVEVLSQGDRRVWAQCASGYEEPVCPVEVLREELSK